MKAVSLLLFISALFTIAFAADAEWSHVELAYKKD